VNALRTFIRHCARNPMRGATRRAGARGFAATRLLRWIAIAAACLIVLFGVVAYWALDTQAGARFVLARVEGALDGKLTVRQADGSLAGPLRLAGVRYRDAQSGIDATIARIDLDIAPWALLAKRVHVQDLAIDGVKVALTTLPPKPEPPSEFSLEAPIDIALDRLVLTRADITRDNQPLFAADRLDLAGAWTREGIALRQLALRAPDGRVDLAGTLATAPGYSGSGTTTFQWKLGDIACAGTLAATSDGRAARLKLVLTAPTPATLTGTLGQTRAWPWTMALDVPRFDPARVAGDTALESLALGLTGSGDREHGALAGNLVVNGHHVVLDPLRYTLDAHTLTIAALHLASPEAAGTLDARGNINLEAKPLSATLAVQWNGVELPADLVGQALATHGTLDVAGSTDAYRANGTLAIGPPGQLADLVLDLAGNPRAITLNQLALKQADGGLDASGTIALDPQLGWQLDAKAHRLDPGAFAADWKGALDFDLATHGTLGDDGPDATVKLDRLGGTLRGRPVSGKADLAIKPGYLIDGTLALASGNSRIDVTGRGGNRNDATVKLAIASLGDWLPDASGRAGGNFHVTGRWPDLAVTGKANGTALALGGTHVDALAATVDVARLKTPEGRVELNADGVIAAGQAFDTVSLVASGNQSAHHVAFDAKGAELSTRLALDGSARDDGQWHATLKTLDLDVKDVAPFALADPAAFDWNGTLFTVGRICLAADGSRVCVAGSSGLDGSGKADYSIEALPLALIARVAAPDAPVVVDGQLGGKGSIARSADGALSGHATLSSDKGSVTYSDNTARPLLAYSGLAVAAELTPQSTHATVHAALDHDGKLDGDVTLGGAAGSTQTLSGRIDATLNDLGFVELLTSEVANARGRLDAHYTLGGTTAAPALDGALQLAGFAIEVPSAGLKLHDGAIGLKAADSQHFVLDGHIASGDGTLAVSGTGGLDPGTPLEVKLSGENFLAADIPAARVVVSPDLVVERSSERVSVTGTLGIPKTRVDLEKLPGGGVSQTSPDVVVVDEERARPGAPLPVYVKVTVSLGKDVALAGLGLDGKIAGQLEVDQTPGKVPIGTGTLNVSGTYKAYGQDLSIESGRLLFAGTPLDNPGLDISAVRKIRDEDIKAGLTVRGTAQVPVLTVFSDPVMEQSEALSYVVTGKPLSQLKSGEGDMLGTAARALGTAGGDLLAKGLGSRLGVEAGVSDNAALGGAAFTVGKYLSPKLYLSYGVGVFSPGEVVTLRYLINKRFNFEAQNATTGMRTGINYRYEK
jgi:translocation and assembly module TamB